MSRLATLGNSASIKYVQLEARGQICLLRMSLWFVPGAASCPQGCRNGGICVAPGICSCPEGWLGGACHTGEFKLLPNHREHSYASMSFTSMNSSVSLLPLPLVQPLFSWIVHPEIPVHSIQKNNNITDISLPKPKRIPLIVLQVFTEGNFITQCFSRCDQTQTWQHTSCWICGVRIYNICCISFHSHFNFLRFFQMINIFVFCCCL